MGTRRTLYGVRMAIDNTGTQLVDIVAVEDALKQAQELIAAALKQLDRLILDSETGEPIINPDSNRPGFESPV